MGATTIASRDLEAQKRGSSMGLLSRIPAKVQNHFVAAMAEFMGTFLFLFFAFAGTQTANAPRSITGDENTDIPQGPDPLVLLYISTCFGVSLTATVWIFFRISGGVFNPAVTIGLCLGGAVPIIRGIVVIPAQIIGGIVASLVVKYLFPGPLAVTTTLSLPTTPVQGMFIEMMLTAQLVFTIYMLAVEKHRATFLAPLGIGLSLFTAELAGVYYTGGSLNPARSFGPCVANSDYPESHWIYWVGPILGAIFATGFYKLLKLMSYERVNPGQDGEGATFALLDDDFHTRSSSHALALNQSFGRPLSIPESLIDRRSVV
ncbi:Aquaporin-2 [Cyphellophora attinorum]|uniref:Aquaporin-2 n=1 Tax=Cyphellophora attinorum TaxID=1664694 RepID=A0A0N1P1F1_9EURO|nr:Aquaporin-2 [Phialophora attinorum]KPI42080.1 Aquaporin-2 [Phialophora attinorum]